MLLVQDGLVGDEIVPVHVPETLIFCTGVGVAVGTGVGVAAGRVAVGAGCVAVGTGRDAPPDLRTTGIRGIRAGVVVTRGAVGVTVRVGVGDGALP